MVSVPHRMHYVTESTWGQRNRDTFLQRTFTGLSYTIRPLTVRCGFGSCELPKAKDDSQEQQLLIGQTTLVVVCARVL